MKADPSLAMLAQDDNCLYDYSISIADMSTGG
jgi:hypothetical protein